MRQVIASSKQSANTRRKKTGLSMMMNKNKHGKAEDGSRGKRFLSRLEFKGTGHQVKQIERPEGKEETWYERKLGMGRKETCLVLGDACWRLCRIRSLV